MKTNEKKAHLRKRSTSREMRTIFTNGLFLKNPVLISALGLYPVVAGGYNLRMGVQLSLLLFLIALPTALTFCLVGGVIPAWLRPGTVLAVSAAFYLPAAKITDLLFPGAATALGVFGGLMICNSMLLSRCNDYAPFHLVRAVLADVFGCMIGYSIILCGFSLLREFLQRGSVWNSNVGPYVAADRGTALPFFGFILLGFAAALAKWVGDRREKRKEPRADKLTERGAL